MKLRYLLALGLLVPLAGCLDKTDTKSANTLKLDTVQSKASYSFGVDFESRLKQQNIDLDTDALVQGIRDSSSGAKILLSEEEMNTARTEFLKKLREDMLAKQAAEGKKNLEEGKAFLAENAKKEGVVTTADGLQYKIIKPGTGPKPTLDDTVTTNYRGTLIDGTEFDSTYTRGKPATFPVKGVIKGWTEALQMMKTGAKWKLWIPADLAYGDHARSKLIGPNATLVFDIDLLSIQSKNEGKPLMGSTRPKVIKKK